MAREEETAKREMPLRPAQGPAASEHRAGAVALSVFASSLNAQILRALGERPMRFTELREAAGCPAQTTLRNRLRQLIWMGAIEKRQVRAVPYGVTHELTDLGGDLLQLAGLLDSWLAASPGGPRSLDVEAGRAAVKAFASGWSSTVFRVLSSESLCLTHLSRLIRHTSYPALERQLSNLRIAGHIEPVSGDRSCNPYAVTEWSRRGVLPLLAAVRCERRRLAGRSAAPTKLDVEAGFFLSLPLARLPVAVNGSCALLVTQGEDREPLGVRVAVREGRVASCDSKLGAAPRSWARGSAAAWLDTGVEGTLDPLEIGGAEPELPRRLLLDVCSRLRG